MVGIAHILPAMFSFIEVFLKPLIGSEWHQSAVDDNTPLLCQGYCHLKIVHPICFVFNIQ